MSRTGNLKTDNDNWERKGRKHSVTWPLLLFLGVIMPPLALYLLFFKYRREKENRISNGKVLFAAGLAVSLISAVSLARNFLGDWEIRADFYSALAVPLMGLAAGAAAAVLGGKIWLRGSQEEKLSDLILVRKLRDMELLGIVCHLSLCRLCDVLERMQAEDFFPDLVLDYAARRLVERNDEWLRLPGFTEKPKAVFDPADGGFWMREKRIAGYIFTGFGILSVFMIVTVGLYTLRKDPSAPGAYTIIELYTPGVAAAALAGIVHLFLAHRRIRYGRCMRLLSKGSLSDAEIMELCGFGKKQLDKASVMLKKAESKA